MESVESVADNAAPMSKNALLACSVLALVAIDASARQDDLLERARRLHKSAPLIDGHNDYPWELRETFPDRDLEKLDISKPQPAIHTDIARLKAGGVGGQFWSVYVPATMAGQQAVTATLEQIDVVHRMMRRYPETFELALTADDVERVFKKGKIASLDRDGGWTLDRLVAWHPSDVSSPRRPVHDAHARDQHPVGGFRNGHREARWPLAVWRGGRA